jgi:hypothetical protein
MRRVGVRCRLERRSRGRPDVREICVAERARARVCCFSIHSRREGLAEQMQYRGVQSATEQDRCSADNHSKSPVPDGASIPFGEAWSEIIDSIITAALLRTARHSTRGSGSAPARRGTPGARRDSPEIARAELRHSAGSFHVLRTRAWRTPCGCRRAAA